MASISITWHVLRDGHKICPICLDMDGYTWTFEVGKNQLGGTLVHPEHGIIWDTVSGSKVHEKPGLYGECHCSISYNIEMGDLVEKVRHLRDEIATLPQRE